MSENRGKLRESLREMVVVVGSILIAFALDAAWDDYREGQEERRLLESVAADMRSNIEALDSAVERHRDIMEASEELLRFMGTPPGDLPLPRFDSLLSRTALYWTYDPRVGSIEAALADLNLVQSHELRSAIAAWPETLRDYREDEEWAGEEVDQQLVPAVQRLVPIGVYPIDTGFGRVIELPEAVKRRLTPEAVLAVLSDLNIVNEVAYRAGRQSGILAEAEDLRALMSGIVDLIDAELGN